MGMMNLPASGTVYLDANWTLKTPDAIHAATAMIEGCEAFITSDRSFGQITSLPLNLLSGRA